MKENLIIRIVGKKISLELENENGVVDTKEWQEDGNLSKTLLSEIANFLKRNKLLISEINPDVEVLADNESYTSARIAKVVAETIKYSLSH